MKIVIDTSPLKTGHFLQHRVRGTGFYIQNLLQSLKTNFPDNTYIEYVRGQKLPSEVDVIHSPYFEPFFYTVPRANLSKTVVTVHDLTPFVFPGAFPPGIKGKFRWFVQKVLLKRCAAIIADSESSKKDIVKFAGIEKDKIFVVYLSAGSQYKQLKDKEMIEKVRSKYNLPEKFALYVGDVTWNKNVPRIIQAAQHANIPLVLIGNALSEDNFDKKNPWNKDRVKIEELLTDTKNIIKAGFVPTEELVAIYNCATVFTMPSLYEGFGLPLLEAMSCGCPVLTAKEGSIPEVVGEAGLYVDARSVEDIANGMEKIFSDNSLRKELSEKGIEQAAKFSWDKTAAQTLKVYNSIL